MPKQIRVLIDCNGSLRSFLWLSIDQGDDGAVSVGTTDRHFIVPGLTSELDQEAVVHVQQVDLTERGIRDLTNPHFTFHPPNHIHLRANEQSYLAEQLVMMDLQLLQETRIPWLTWVSRRVSDLQAVRPGRISTADEQVVVRSPDSNCSIHLNIDFIRSSGDAGKQAELLLDHVVCWRAPNPQSMTPMWCLHLTAQAVPPRDTTVFTWHQSN
jgi:hypothetical protein